MGNEPFRFISSRDLPDPLPSVLAMGSAGDAGLVISDTRHRDILAQEGSAWLTTAPVSVIPEMLVDRSPSYMPRPRARRKECTRVTPSMWLLPATGERLRAARNIDCRLFVRPEMSQAIKFACFALKISESSTVGPEGMEARSAALAPFTGMVDCTQ